VTAYGRRIDSLMAEIAAYLAFMDEVRADDRLWREYWSRKSVTERIAAYSMYR